MTQPSEARPPTIYDVAEAAGVSKSLVSLVLQGSPRVSPARRAAVEQAIERLQYRPSQAAATLAGQRTRTVGVLLDDYRNLWFVELLAGLQEELAPAGIRVAVEDFSLNSHVGQAPVDGFVALRVDGIVIAMEPTEGMAATMGIPAVVAGNRELELAGADVVANDDRMGGALATEHLISLGHRDIVHLTGPGGAARLRSEGFAETARTAGVAVRITSSDDGTTESDGYLTAGRALDEDPEISAIFAANDTMAFGAFAAARERGRRIPEDLSLIGYDNSPLASANLLRMTTIDGRSSRVGAEAAKALLTRITEPGLPIRRTLIGPRLVVRSSTAAPPRQP